MFLSLQVRIGADGSFDDAVRSILPFWLTNARSQLSISVHPSNPAAADKCVAAGFGDVVVLEDDAGFEHAVGHNKPYNVVHAASSPPEKLPLAGQFISTLFCVGHVKSTASDDAAFFEEFTNSDKWLKVEA